MTKRAMIFGVGGQDGAYLAKLLVAKGYEVYGTSRDAEVSSFDALARLGVRDSVRLHSANLNDFRSVIQVLRETTPDEIYNLSAQSSVGLSFDQPIETVNSIVNATLNVLEAIRFLGGPLRFYNASSSEMFGDTGDKPASETTPFKPRSPYGVSKAAAHWMVETYRKGYGLYACSGILFNHESPLRKERFVTQKIVRGAIDIKRAPGQRLRLGNVGVVRDWGWAEDYVAAMWLMLQQPEAEDFVIATGEGATIAEFAEVAFACVGLHWRDHVDFDAGLLRPSEIERTVGDAGKAKRLLGWQARHRMRDIVVALVEAELARRAKEDRGNDDRSPPTDIRR